MELFKKRVFWTAVEGDMKLSEGDCVCAPVIEEEGEGEEEGVKIREVKVLSLRNAKVKEIFLVCETGGSEFVKLIDLEKRQIRASSPSITMQLAAGQDDLSGWRYKLTLARTAAAISQQLQSGKLPEKTVREMYMALASIGQQLKGMIAQEKVHRSY